MPIITPFETNQLINEIIGGASVAGGNPNIGDWVEDLHLLAQVLTEQEVN